MSTETRVAGRAARPIPVSVGVTGVVGFSCLLAVISRDVRESGPSAGTSGLALITVAVLLTLQILVSRQYGDAPPALTAATALAAQAVLVEALTLTDGLSVASILYLALPFPVVFWLGARAGVWSGAAILAWFTLRFTWHKPAWLTDSASMNAYTLFVIAVVLVTATALLIRREQASRYRAETLLHDLGASHRQLIESQSRVAELATIEERNRLARDIHDSLGQHLTVISVQLEKAQLLVEADQEAAVVAVGNAKRLADQALSDVRHSVRALRKDEAPFVLGPALESLVADLQVLPFELDLQLTGDEQRYSGQQLLALYRAAQEGLTNVQRHARASRVSLEVDLGAETASLTLDDDGIGPPIDPGNGLRGIRERLELVSGRLQLTAAPGGGTRLSVSVPRTTTGKR